MKLSVFLSFVLISNMGFAGESTRISQSKTEVKKDYFFTFEQFKQLDYAQQMVYLNFLTSYQAVLELQANDNKFVDEKWLSASKSVEATRKWVMWEQLYQALLPKAEAWIITLGKAVITKGGKLWSWVRSGSKGAATVAEEVAPAAEKLEQVVVAESKVMSAAEKGKQTEYLLKNYGKPGMKNAGSEAADVTAKAERVGGDALKNKQTEYYLKNYGTPTASEAKVVEEGVAAGKQIMLRPNEVVPYKPGLYQKGKEFFLRAKDGTIKLIKDPKFQTGMAVTEGANLIAEGVTDDKGKSETVVNRETANAGNDGANGKTESGKPGQDGSKLPQELKQRVMLRQRRNTKNSPEKFVFLEAYPVIISPLPTDNCIVLLLKII